MPDIIPLKGRKAAPKALRSTMETLIITPDQVNQWRVPMFQRPVRVNAKVTEIAEEMKADGTAITGIITLGKLVNDPIYYLVDGQHRVEAFRLSGMAEIIADVRVIHFDSMADMSDEYVKLNSSIVKPKPDDILRGLAPTLPRLQRIARECPWVGFDSIRRGHGSPIVSMSAVLRCWNSGRAETPSSSNYGTTPVQMASRIDDEDTNKLIRYLQLALAAWGRDPEYYRLWSNCNMGLTMWLFHRLVLDTNRRGNSRVSVLTETQFKQCLMALSANSNYVDWLPGRLLNDRDRSPALQRIKSIFAKRLIEGGVVKPQLPQPTWASRVN